MKRLKISVTLLFAAAFVSAALIGRTASSQGQSPSTYPNTPLTAAQSAALETTTNQADKVSATCPSVSAGFNRFGGPDCGPGIDCESIDPFSFGNFTFDTGENTRPE